MAASRFKGVIVTIEQALQMRTLLESEMPLFAFLLEEAGIEIDLLAIKVHELDDGGMGSLAIGESHETRNFGEEVANCQFNDSDGVVVSATLNVDEANKLYELDVWKTDFAPLVQWPKYDELKGHA